MKSANFRAEQQRRIRLYIEFDLDTVRRSERLACSRQFDARDGGNTRDLLGDTTDAPASKSKKHGASKHVCAEERLRRFLCGERKIAEAMVATPPCFHIE